MNSWKLEIAQGFKSPTLFQRYSPEYGNTELKPETTQTVSLEYSHNTENYSVSFAPFYTKTEDLIVVTGPSNSLKYQNLDEAEVLGVETLVRYSKEGYRSGLNFTYQEPKDLTDKTWLLRRPRWLAGAYMAKDFSQFDIGLDVRAVGSRKDLRTRSATTDLNQYTLWNLSSNYRVSDSITGKFQLRNIFDTRFEESFGYRSEGFIAYLGLEWMN
jgi:outer membrane cobalamin receptor